MWKIINVSWVSYLILIEYDLFVKKWDRAKKYMTSSKFLDECENLWFVQFIW